MKILSFLFIFSLMPSILQAQVSTSAKYKLTLSYGVSFIDPVDINDHIAISNTVFTSTAKTIKYAPEIAGTFLYRPWQDDKILVIRAGYMSNERRYSLTIPETIDTTTITGCTSGSIKETYTAYPFSIGLGIASQDLSSLLQIEFIFGLGYINEEQSYTSSTGQRSSYARSLFSPAYGFRVAGNLTVPISNNTGITLECGYRFLSFHEYEDESTTQPSNITFSYSGFNAVIGLSILF